MSSHEQKPGPGSLGPNFPSTIAASPTAGVGGCLLMVRVGRVLQDLCAGRTVTDDDLLQHRNDCRELMEAAHDRWQNGCESLEVVQQWQAYFLEACKRLSLEWKAAREAQIQRSITDGVGFFVTQGDADRRALEQRST